ncbi:MAG: cytochrome c5 [Cellvibrionaceae bacterium]|jgi:cytochrome c5
MRNNNDLRWLIAAIIIISVLFVLGCSTNNTDIKKGEAIYVKACKVCHAQGIIGAPVLGNQANWRDRKGQGVGVLVQHAVNGYGLMPAKGGKTELTDQEIRYVVKYMLSALEES